MTDQNYSTTRTGIRAIPHDVPSSCKKEKEEANHHEISEGKKEKH